MAPSLKTVARVLVEGTFVVPETQVHVLDVPWQLFTYQVFHQHALNRLIHVAGISISTAGTYALAEHFAPGMGAVLACGLAALHVALARRADLLRLAPVIVAVHAGLWLAARVLLRWLAAASDTPALVLLGIVIAASLLQTLGHAAEPLVPAPIAGGPRWVELGNWWRGMSMRRAAWFLLLPGYAFVEALSAPRNLFLIIALSCHRIGVSSDAFRSLVARIAHVAHSADPPLRRVELHDALAKLSVAPRGAEPV